MRDIGEERQTEEQKPETLRWVSNLEMHPIIAQSSIESHAKL
jgi:hypothetical protein